ncbi:MAG: hypothetical protein JNM18_19150 [Planctomycetaceae bacterium]|nr:hypothetical protein [Planctomycetaceae bacterium]
MLLATLGCSRWSLPKLNFDEPAEKKPAAGPLQVKVDAHGQPLREGQLTTTAVPELLQRADVLLTDQRRLSLRYEVAQRMDTALEMLRGLTEDQAPLPATKAVAVAYDELLSIPAGNGWTTIVEAAQSRQSSVVAYAKERRDWLDSLRQGAINSLKGDALTRAATQTPGKMLTIDAWQLRGITALVANEPTQAVTAFEQARQIASTLDPYQTVQIGLLLSDALRRAERAAEADQVWQATVSAAGQLVDRAPPVIDPGFWDKASYLRPVSLSWPDDVVARLERRGPFIAADASVKQPPLGPELNRLPGDQEAIVWAWIGASLLERAETQSALVAFKRAESSAQNEALRLSCRLQQAHALARLGQSAAATAQLVTLSGDKQTPIAKASLAALGSLKLHQGDLSAAHRLLTKALDEGTPTMWPDRVQSEADLGLVTIMRGDNAGGLQRLHNAQRQFEAQGDQLSLARSLWNEQKFLEHTGKKDEALAVQQRWKAIESSAHVIR